MTLITTAPAQRRFFALLVAGALALATAAVVSGDEHAGNRPDVPAGPPIVVAQHDDEGAEDAAEDAIAAAEDAEEAVQDALERQQEAAEDEAEAADEAADDCTAPDEGTEATFGQEMCAFAQSWKDGTATEAPEGWGEQVSAFARENNPGAEIQEQIAANGTPNAAADALQNAGPTGNGPPGGGDDDEDEEGDE